MKRLLLLAITLCLLSVGTAAAQETAERDISPELVTQLEAIEAYVTQVRGLERLEPVERVFPSRVDVQTYLNESVEAQLTPEMVADSQAFYYVFDFVTDPNIDIVGVYLDLLEDQIGGYYDPEEETMNTILISGGELDDSLPLLEQIIYAHEFVHALQDQHYDLASLGFSPDQDMDEIEVDRFIAVQALVEGDATFVMNRYTERIVEENPFAAFSLLSSAFTSGSMDIPPGTPDILTQELLFPYNEGLTFVTALVNAEGSYDIVDAAFDDLPQSSEHILHPQTYLNGDMPVTVTLGDTDAALGAGWSLVNEDTLGEFYLQQHLGTQLPGRVLSEESEFEIGWRAAAAGWGGDRYRIYRNEDGALAMVMRLAWDTPADSDEFATAYADFGETRFSTPADESGCWTGTDTSICFVTLPGGESVVTRAPSLDVAQVLLSSQS
jgi:hypothetical protein